MPGRRPEDAGGFVARLSGGDLRAKGEADAVAAEVLGERDKLAQLFEALACDDPIVRSRASHAVVTVSRAQPDWLTPHKPALLAILANDGQQEVLWHVTQVVPRLDLEGDEVSAAYAVFERQWRESRSRFQKTFALQALADLAERYPDRVVPVRALVEEGLRSEFPAVAARARKLIKRLG